MIRSLLVALALAALAALAACDAAPAAEPPRVGTATEAAPVAPRRPTGTAPERNIGARDFVGPEACGACHADKHATWRVSLHARMNQRAIRTTILGSFDGTTVAYAGGHARFAWRAGEPVMELVGPAGVARRYRVTRTIGSRHLQEYVGLLVDGPEAADDPARTTEVRLPFGYWLDRRGWYPQPFYDSWFPTEYDGDHIAFDPYEVDRSPWAARCAWCHNTYPFELRAVRAAGSEIGMGLERFVEWIGAPDPRGPALARDNLLPVADLVTVGISCESCHLGGRHHAEDGARISFVPAAPELAARSDAPDLARGRSSPEVVTGICGACHSTPTPRWPDGAAQRNSSEALDLAGSACAARIRCVDCHDPHRAGPGADTPDRPEHIAACLGCHPALRDPAAAERHARHRPGDASCLDCHMPRVVQGLSTMIRSHRIASPTSPRPDAPDACGLCHLDRPLAWTRAALAEGWPDRAHTRAAEPLDARAAGPSSGATWLAGSDGALRIAAAHAYARGPLGEAALPELLAGIDDPVAHDRLWMLLAVERILGRRLTRTEYDPLAPPPLRAAQRARLRRAPPR